MAIGLAVHEAAAADNLAKVRTGDPLPLADVTEVAVSAYEDLEPTLETSPLARGAGKDDASGGARGWGLHASPLIPRPIEVEQAAVARIAELEVCGVLDYGDEDGVYDLKVGRRHPAGAAARSSQLTIYGLLRRSRLGVWPRMVALDVLKPALGGRPWIHERQFAQRTDGDYLSLLERLRAAQALVAAGTFLPAAEGEFSCSALRCEFWQDCRFVSPTRRWAGEAAVGE